MECKWELGMEKDNENFDPDNDENGSGDSDDKDSNPTDKEPTEPNSDSHPIDDNSYEENTPEWFVDRIFKGDEAAETALYYHYKEIILFIMNTKYSGKPFIEDVLQETIIAVIDSLRQGRLREPKALNAYVRQTLYNIINKYLKGNYKRKNEDEIHSIRSLEDSNQKPDEIAEYEQRKNLVADVIDEMPTERDRKILRHYFSEERSKAEVCKILDLTPVHFDRVLHRARKRLKDRFDDKWGHLDNNDHKDRDDEGGNDHE